MPGTVAVNFWRLARDYPGLVAGLLLVITVLLVALLMPLPYDPLEVNAFRTLQPPSSAHWLGTDHNGGDVFSRVIAAAQVDLPLALFGAALSATIGVPFGLMASSRGKIAQWMMRGLDIFQSFPLLIISLVLVALAGNNLSNVVYAIVLTNSPRFIRLVRSEALTVRASRFIEAAQAIGAGSQRVTFVHVLPNVTGTIFTQLSISVGGAILTIAALAFLGVGIVPPTPSWGAMIRAGAPFVVTGQWWLALVPGIAIMTFVLSFNAIAEGLDSMLRADD